MSDSEQTGTEDSTSVNSKISTTVTIFCSCNKQSCCAFWCGKFNSYWRLLTLGTLVVMYLAMGALIFSLVEGPNERRQVEMVQQERAQALDELTIKVQDLTNLSQAEARNVTIAIIALGVAASRTIPAEENPIWDYSSAFFFSSTVITTIGYGTIFPTTAAGQIIFIFYAVMGIPLALVFLSQIGSVIDKFIHASLTPVKRRYGKAVARAAGLAILLLVTTIFFILIPAAIYSGIETWNYWESIYFTVVSLTTVGFGDFVPAQAGSRPDSAALRLYGIFSSAWLWIGLALVAAIIGEVQSVIVALGKYRSKIFCIRARKVKEKVDMRMNTAKADHEDDEADHEDDEADHEDDEADHEDNEGPSSGDNEKPSVATIQ